MQKKVIQKNDFVNKVNSDNNEVKTISKTKTQIEAETKQKYYEIFGDLLEHIKKSGLEQELSTPEMSNSYVTAALQHLIRNGRIIEHDQLIQDIGFSPEQMQYIYENPDKMLSYVLCLAVIYGGLRHSYKKDFRERVDTIVDIAYQSRPDRLHRFLQRWIGARKIIEKVAGVVRTKTTLTIGDSGYYTKNKKELIQRAYLDFVYTPPIHYYKFLKRPEEVIIDGQKYKPNQETIYRKGIIHLVNLLNLPGAVKQIFDSKRLPFTFNFTHMQLAPDQIEELNCRMDEKGVFVDKDTGKPLTDKTGKIILTYATKGAKIDCLGYKDVEINAEKNRADLTHDREGLGTRYRNIYKGDIAEKLNKSINELTFLDIWKNFINNARYSVLATITTVGLGVAALFSLLPWGYFGLGLASIIFAMRGDYHRSERIKEARFVETLLKIREDSSRIVQQKLLEETRRIEKRSEELRKLFNKIRGFQGGQTIALEEINSSMDQYTKGIQDITSQMADLSTLMSSNLVKIKNLTDSRELQEKMINTQIKQINDVSKELKVNNEDIKELIKEAQKLSGIVEAINDISDRINLLSLNAAIEAARAGDAGRGFAVVADEIGKLAEQTQDNLKELIAPIDYIISNFGVVYDKNSANLKKHEDSGEALAVKIQESNLDSASLMTSVEESTEKINELTQNVSATMEEMSAQTEEISAGLGTMSRNSVDEANLLDEEERRLDVGYLQ